MWIEVYDVVLHQLLGQHDGVLEVVAVPGHERDQHVAAERELAAISVDGAVCDDVARASPAVRDAPAAAG